MKRTVLLLLFCIFMTSVFSQQSSSDLYVVHFKDKGLKKSAQVNPSIFLSDKAVERRLKQNISFDQSDIPVNDQYILQVSIIGARVVTRSRWFNTIVIEADAQAVKSIQALPFISEMQLIGSVTKQTNTPVSEKQYFRAESVNPSISMSKKLATNDLYNYGNAYNQINQLKGQSLHNMGFSGQGMTIAVIDAGFNSADIMTCFDSLRANHQILGSRDFVQPGNNIFSTTMNSHGTMVLSCMAANSSGQMVGTAPNADYWLLRSEVAATESIIEEYYWVSAAEFADSVGADLINSSLGYTTFDNPASNHTYADMDGNTTVVTRGADKAAEKGILVVNSAGNSGGAGWWYIGAPADGDSVFTIGAVNASGIRASFSSVGPTSDRRIKPTVAAQGYQATVFAPGSNPAGILSSANGTSFSSPIICGISACLWQANPHLNNMQIIEAIKATASQASQPDSLLGWGIPDYSQALIYLPVYSDAAGKALLAYPNPVTDHLTIGFPLSVQGKGKYILQIINLQGKTVYSRQQDMGLVRSFQIHDISDIPAGIYFIRISNGLLSFSTRIIKI